MFDLANDFLDKRYFYNPVHDWLLAAGIAVGTVLLFMLFKRYVVGRVRRLSSRSTTRIDDIIVSTLDSTKWFFYLTLAVLLGSDVLAKRPSTEDKIETVAIIVTFVQIGVWLQAIIRGAVERWAQKRQYRGAGTMAAAVGFVSRVVVWSMVFLLVLSNLGIEISALVAGLGVGGVAAALAVQSLLGDVFASISIYFDRPFDIGDFIIVDEYLGTVERIGMRSTRLASLGGEEIIFANNDLIRSRIRNYGRMKERRIAFQIGVEYNLSYEKVAKVSSLLREAVEAVDGVRFDRAHFKEYGDFSLNFEIVYYVLSPVYNVYMDKQEAINLGIYRRLSEEKIPFAFPSRTVYLRGMQAPGEEAPPERGPRLVAGESR